MKTLSVLLLLSFLWLSGVAQQAVSSQSDRKNVSVTIYNNGIGIVRETRDLKLPKGISFLRFEDVAENIVPQTVRVKPLDDKNSLQVFEQNYEYDLISTSRLMEKYVGKKVKIYREKEDGSEEMVEAILIANNYGPVFQIGNEISLGMPGRVVVPTIPDNLYSKPTLIWKLNSNGGTIPAEVSYQSEGMNWNADYVLVLDSDEKLSEITSWVTLYNQSGAAFENATLQLVAGSVQRADIHQPMRAKKGYDSDVLTMAEDIEIPSFAQENLSEYYLYTLDQATTIGMNQTKQVQLFATDRVPITKRYIVENLNMYQGSGSNPESALIRYELTNSKDQQLGRPLPAGVIRVFKADSKGRQQLLGEDQMNHTPVNEMVKFSVGKAFDVVASGKQMAHENFRIGTGYTASYEVSLRNRKTETVTVRYYANVSGDWKVTNSSHKFTRESVYKTYTDVTIKPDSEVTLTYSVEVRY